MVTGDIALAASARTWPDRLHRFLLDHGGGRIVGRIMSPEQANEGGFDVLLIDDVCSFLTPRLVAEMKRSGSEVVGVFVPDDGPDAKRRLLECGISDVIESDATPEEFLDKIGQTLAHRSNPVVDYLPRRAPLTIAVTGPAEGVGMSEVAVSLASALSSRISTVLIDLDRVWPSVAQRLGLPLHPNVRTALDHALHRPDKLASAIQQTGRLSVIGGAADGGRGHPIGRHEVLTLIDALGHHCEVLVADLGAVFDVESGLLREFDTLVVVGSPTPVGVARLARSLEYLIEVGNDPSVLTILNQSARGFRRAESVSELDRLFPALPVLSIPYDRRVSDAAWDGTIGFGAGYRRAVQSMCDVVVGSLT